MQKLLSYFFADYRYQNQSRWFKTALYSFLAVKCVYWLFYFDLFFGEHSIVFIKPISTGFINNLAYLLYNLQLPYLNLTALVTVLMLCLVSAVFKKRLILGDALIWFLTLNIHNLVYTSLSGGDYLLNQFLLFNSFISYQRLLHTNFTSQLRVFMHNMGSIAIITQLCFAYFLSALAKLVNSYWLNGHALGTTQQIKHFSLCSFPPITPGLNWIYSTLTYLVLLYQLGFPLLIFAKRFKKPVLLCGVAMHLFIAIVMGLPWFSVTMVLGYIYLWPSKNEVN